MLDVKCVVFTPGKCIPLLTANHSTTGKHCYYFVHSEKFEQAVMYLTEEAQ